MKSIVNLGESNLEIKDFNRYLSQPEAGTFRAATPDFIRETSFAGNREIGETRFSQPSGKNIC